MNYTQLLTGVLVIGVLIASAYFMFAPQTDDTVYQTYDSSPERSIDSFDAQEESDAIEAIEDKLDDAEDRIENLEDEMKDVVSASPEGYTLTDVAAHATEEDCWTAINGMVYDLTAFFGKHPGGDKNLFRVCGIDGTEAFERKHGGEERPEKTLAGFEIGKLAE